MILEMMDAEIHELADSVNSLGSDCFCSWAQIAECELGDAGRCGGQLGCNKRAEDDADGYQRQSGRGSEPDSPDGG